MDDPTVMNRRIRTDLVTLRLKILTKLLEYAIKKN